MHAELQTGKPSGWAAGIDGIKLAINQYTPKFIVTQTSTQTKFNVNQDMSIKSCITYHVLTHLLHLV